MYAERYQSIDRWATELDGVFTLADLKVALEVDSQATLFRNLAEMTDKGVLVKVKRGLYAVPGASLEVISSRIEPQAYISTGTVLARHAIIGSIPARKVQAVKTGRPRSYRCSLGTIEHLSITPRLYFGFDAENGRRVATPEKAFLDVCYFRYKGKTFSFDPASDVNFDALDERIIRDYLDEYDPRFAAFFERIWSKA